MAKVKGGGTTTAAVRESRVPAADGIISTVSCAGAQAIGAARRRQPTSIQPDGPPAS